MKHYLRLASLLILLALPLPGVRAQAPPSAGPRWIWYPNDFEIWLSREVHLRRNEKGHTYSPFWRLDSHYGSVRYRKHIRLTAPETFAVYADGRFNVLPDVWNSLSFHGNEFTLPAGEHDLQISVVNYDRLPALWVKSAHYQTDETWKVSEGSGRWLPASSGTFADPAAPPATFHLRTEPLPAPVLTRQGPALLADFGKETFGFLTLQGVQGMGPVRVCYGESREEALSPDSCETYDEVQATGAATLRLPVARAFRYVQVVPGRGVAVGGLTGEYEFLPETYRGQFRCSDEKLNRIWQTAAYTLHLNTREFFLDGIKRDRWVWSGDAYQSYQMNNYLFFDADVTKRTLLALRGKDPVATHLNTILDYTFFWFIGLGEYYQYSGDSAFVRRTYPSMVSLMDFCLKRTNARGLVEGQPGDWVFVDWADMEKDGELSFEQILFLRSLETMRACASLAGDAAGQAKYAALATSVRARLDADFWDPARQAFVHSRQNGAPRPRLTRYPNMFALLYGYLSPAQAAQVKQSVLKNTAVQPITTPYMRFFELAALCEAGEQAYVAQQVRAYWGGMLDQGATTFWEEFDPTKSGRQRLAMYNRPYGKSLCHAWGAGPLYLFGRYFLGVRPTAPGYQVYRVEPRLGGLQWIDGQVPTPHGNVAVYASRTRLKVRAEAGWGVLHFRSRSRPAVTPRSPLRRLDADTYELALRPGQAYAVRYSVVE